MVTRPLPLILALLAGCASAPPLDAPRPVMVKVPVYHQIYCEVPRLERPALPVAQLTSAARPADTMRAYAATVILLKGAVEQRDAVIAGCLAPDAAAARPSKPPTVSPLQSRVTARPRALSE